MEKWGDSVTVGNEYCNQLEGAENLSTRDFVTVIVRILPLLYIVYIFFSFVVGIYFIYLYLGGFC